LIITLYNVNERDKDSYLSKLKEIEKTANFVSNREGNRPKIRIETTDNDISSDEIVEKLENLGFYIFNKENIAFNFRTGGHIGTIELTLGKNLLIVGNGFDIGHGLKTKYSNFLDNINILNEILLCASSDHSINPTIQYNDKNIAEAFNNTFDIIFNSLDKDLDDKFALQDFCTEFAKKKNTSNYPTGKTRRNVASNVNAFKTKYKDISTEDKHLLSLAERILLPILSNINGSGYSYNFNTSNIITTLTKTNDMKIKWFLAEHFIKENTLLQYFLKKYNDKSIGDKWIDIETELSKIVMLAENIIKTLNNGQKYLVNKEQLEPYFDTLCILSNIGIESTSIPLEKEILQINISRLEKELDNFIYLLENYLIYEENKITSHSKNFSILKDIYDIAQSITHLLSFNYTDTFRQLYDTALNDNVDFIHGKLKEHNLVLGIGETLDETEESNIILCIRFKKYFQRIFKQTGAKYDDWSIKTVYIYGHSLDVTDKEILQPIIEKAQKVIIFYYDKSAYDQQIINLVKILGKQKFIKYVSKAINKIEFREQSNLQISKS
jgi:hypothetical protein